MRTCEQVLRLAQQFVEAISSIVVVLCSGLGLCAQRTMRWWEEVKQKASFETILCQEKGQKKVAGGADNREL